MQLSIYGKQKHNMNQNVVFHQLDVIWKNHRQHTYWLQSTSNWRRKNRKTSISAYWQNILEPVSGLSKAPLTMSLFQLLMNMTNFSGSRGHRANISQVCHIIWSYLKIFIISNALDITTKKTLSKTIARIIFYCGDWDSLLNGKPMQRKYYEMKCLCFIAQKYWISLWDMCTAADMREMKYDKTRIPAPTAWDWPNSPTCFNISIPGTIFINIYPLLASLFFNCYMRSFWVKNSELSETPYFQIEKPALKSIVFFFMLRGIQQIIIKDNKKSSMFSNQLILGINVKIFKPIQIWVATFLGYLLLRMCEFISFVALDRRIFVEKLVILKRG